MASKVDFIVIKTEKDGIFISDNVKGEGYFSSKIGNLSFDDEKLIQTPKKDWYKISELPKSIKVRGATEYANRRYELKEGFPISDLTPKTIPYGELDDEDDIYGLYTLKHDLVEGGWEEIEFDLEILSEEVNFITETPKYKGTPSLMIQLTTHPSLHSERPCSISGKELYKIVRNYINLYINGQHAKVTSNYDFCLTVEKVSHLSEKESYAVSAGTKRKPTTITKYRDTRSIVIFKSSPEGYSGYPTQKGIEAKNQKELDEKVTEYLENLIKEINEPLEDCTCCKGKGVIIKNN